MTGGAIAGSKTYLKTTTYIEENSWKFMGGLADMNHARDAHEMISWKERNLIVVGSWHVEIAQGHVKFMILKKTNGIHCQN